MRVLFYVGTDGEVLSNKQYPVTKPELFIPVVPNIPIDALADIPLTSRVVFRRYLAFTLEVPEK